MFGSVSFVCHMFLCVLICVVVCLCVCCLFVCFLCRCIDYVFFCVLCFFVLVMICGFAKAGSNNFLINDIVDIIETFCILHLNSYICHIMI